MWWVSRKGIWSVNTHALAHQVVSQVGSEHVRRESRAHALAVNRHGAHNAGCDVDARDSGVHRVKQRLLVFLQVLVVCRWDAFDRDHEACEVAKQASALATQQLEAVRVLLLRHDRGAGAC